MAKFYFQTNNKEAGLNQNFLIEAWFDPEGKEINVLSGKIVLPQNYKLEKILETEKYVSLWIEKPKLIGNEIVFAGMIPGGINEKIKLFSFYGKSENSGEINFSFKDLQVFLNDGLGTEIKANFEPLKIKIVKKKVFETQEFIDQNPPQIIEYQIQKLPDINKWSLIFRGIDKESGISHYEILEDKNWQKVESPYILKNQLLNQKIYLKAVDNFGNEKIIEIPAQRPYLRIEFLGLIIIFLIFVLLIKFYKRR